MPNYDNNKLKGTLFITIDVEFPRGSLPAETREGVYVTSVILKPFCIIRSLFSCASLCAWLRLKTVFFSKLHVIHSVANSKGLDFTNNLLWVKIWKRAGKNYVGQKTVFL